MLFPPPPSYSAHSHGALEVSFKCTKLDYQTSTPSTYALGSMYLKNGTQTLYVLELLFHSEVLPITAAASKAGPVTQYCGIQASLCMLPDSSP